MGARVAQTLTLQGYSVAGLTREGQDSDDCSDKCCAAWTTLNGLSAFFENKSLFAVVHLATDYGRDGCLSGILESNVQLPLKLLDFCAATNCTLFLSTDTFFGKPEFNYSHMRPYIYSKQNFSNWAKLFCETHPLMRVSNLRLEQVYGEGDGPHKFVTDLISKLQKNQLVIPMTPGDQLRDFVYVDDVADAYGVLLAQGEGLPVGFTEYEVGTGTATSIREFSELACRMIGSRSQLNFGALTHRPNEIMASKACTAPLKSYGWNPATTIVEGLTRSLGSKVN